MPNQSPSSGKGRPPYSLVFLAAALVVIILTFRIFSPILLSLLLILLFALALNPIVSWLRRLSGGRAVATLIILMLFLGIVGLTGWAFYVPVKEAAGTLIERLPEYWERIQRPLVRLEQRAVISEKRLKEEVSDEVIREESARRPDRPPDALPDADMNAPEAGSLLRDTLGQLLSGMAGGFRAVASNIVSFFIVVATVAFGVIFMLINPRPVFRFLFEWVPEQHHERALRITQRIVEMVPRWALATLLGMFVVGMMVFFAMWPILGFQDALLLALIAFVLEAVPYVGPVAALIPAFLLALNQGGFAPLWVLIAYAAIQFLESNLIVPVIVGGRLKQHPLAVLFSVLICLMVFGVFGVFLAVPAVFTFNILHEELYQNRFLPGVSDEDLDRLAKDALDPATFKRGKPPPN